MRVRQEPRAEQQGLAKMRVKQEPRAEQQDLVKMRVKREPGAYQHNLRSPPRQVRVKEQENARRKPHGLQVRTKTGEGKDQESARALAALAAGTHLPQAR